MGKGTKRKKYKKKDRQTENEIVLGVSTEEFAYIQEMAYYNAMKRLERDRETESIETGQKESISKNESKINFFKFCIYMILRPSKAQEKLGLNVRIYDVLLSMVISGIYKILGHLIRLISIALCILIFKQKVSLIIGIYVVIVAFVSIVMGSLLIISGVEFEKQDDRNCLYAYSASFIALIGLIVSTIGVVCN